MFRLFREVLDGNNRALEIITEMGDVLGGEYLFDAEYVRAARAALAASVDRSLRAFEELTHGRYRSLRRVASAIDERIGRVVDDTAPPSRALVVLDDEVTPDRAQLVGDKSANLALLRSAAKIDVPAGFAVTTAAFDAFLRHNRIGERILAARRDHGEPSPSPDELATLLLAGELPADLARALDEAVGTLRARVGRDVGVAVRSSATGEDGEHSFAGVFETILNVPLRGDAVQAAYRRVIASVFSRRASAYRERFGYAPGATKMAVACMAMVDAVASGVLYTSSPGGAADAMVIDAAWGLGTSVVEGRTDADHLVVKKDGTGAVVEERIGEKATMVVPRPGGGTAEIGTPRERRLQRCVDRDQLARLVDAGLLIERQFRSPQDVEWAIDGSGRIFVLQCRPLAMHQRAADAPVEPTAARPISFKRAGTVVQEGTAVGRVHVLKSPNELDSVPRGAVLVTHRDSSDLVPVMPFLAAIVTDVGAATSHMASLSREFRIPSIVNTGDATRLLRAGQEVTVVAGGDGAAVYPGAVARAAGADPDRSARMEALQEFRRRRYVLRLIAPLNLVDPLRDDFSPEACRTVHDVLRFVHEKSVTRLIEAAGIEAGSRSAARLELSVPAGFAIIDIGGGLEKPARATRIALEHVTSAPFRALAGGLIHPGVWHSEAVPLTTGDLLSSMFRTPDVVAESARFGETNVAVVSREYANVNMRFGYHYAIVDCYCSDVPRNNHVVLRFAGGATDITKRSLRLRLIEDVLEQHGFNVRIKGDLLVGRLANLPADEMLGILDQLGRLLAYTRQLDAVLADEGAVRRLASRFIGGTYGIE